MDIGCGMEFQFPVSNHLPEFGETASGIHDKLDLGPGQLLDSVSVTAPCTDHDGSDKHLTAADFKLDLGPANDLVSSVDFHLETSVSDISSESTISEECSEGYSIVNTALEGGTSVPKHTIPVSCALNLGNVTNVQTIQLNQVNLSSMQSMQVIPIQNMQILSSVRPVQNFNRIQAVNTETVKMGIPGLVNTSAPSAVLLGNVLLLQTVPRHVSVCHGGNIISASTNELEQNQILHILNSQQNQYPSSVPLPNQGLKLAQTSVKIDTSISSSYSPNATVGSILRDRGSHVPVPSPYTSYNHGNEENIQSNSFGTENIPCENVMSLNTHAVAQQMQNVGTEVQGTKVPENEMHSQKNTKILVYGKNIALTFDCRNQKNVMNSIAKAMSSPPTTVINVAKSGFEYESKQKNEEEDVFSPTSSKTLKNTLVVSDKSQNFENNLQNMKYVSILKPRSDSTISYPVMASSISNLNNGMSSILSDGATSGDSNTKGLDADRTCDTCILPGLNMNTENQSTSDKNQSTIDNTCQKPVYETEEGLNAPGFEEVIDSYSTSRDDNHCSGPSAEKRMKIPQSSPKEKVKKVMISVLHSSETEENDKGSDYTYSCDLCSATFNRQGNYTRHRMIHTIGGKDSHRYKCPECERMFLQRCDMKRHMLIHTNQQPYKCSECGKGYIRNSDLVVHMRFHKKERAFKCKYCQKAFFQSGDLNRHIRSLHQSASLLKCGHCNRQYSKEATLIRHMQTAHSDIIERSLQEKYDLEHRIPVVPQELLTGDKTGTGEVQ